MRIPWFYKKNRRLVEDDEETPGQFFSRFLTRPKIALMLIVAIPLLIALWLGWIYLLGILTGKMESYVEPTTPSSKILKGVTRRLIVSTPAALKQANVTKAVSSTGTSTTTTSTATSTTQALTTSTQKASTTTITTEASTTTTTQKPTTEASTTTTEKPVSVVEFLEVNKAITSQLIALDKEDDNEAFKTCDSNHFACVPTPWNNYTKILPWTRRCDGKFDCWNGDDERNCTKCLTSFSCKHADGVNLQCLMADRVCDGIADCSDSSDETTYCNRNCTEDEIECRKWVDTDYSTRIKTCMPKDFVCAGEPFCRHYAGNANCTSCPGHSRSCISSSDEKCVSIHEMCDGKSSCFDHRDEHFFHCNGTRHCPGSCSLNGTDVKYQSFVMGQYRKWMSSITGKDSSTRCTDGKSYSPLYACDGHHNMCDGQCKRCTGSGFLCKNEKRCIPMEKRCDSVKDCADESDEDEHECENRSRCNHDENRCDGYCHCKDCRDEQKCTSCKESESNWGSYFLYGYRSRSDREQYLKKMKESNQDWMSYTKYAFHCKVDNTCISIQKRCNGVKDCSDNSDEENCSCLECLMHPERMYICEQGNRCFKYDKVCDNEFQSQCPNATESDTDHCNLMAANAPKIKAVPAIMILMN